MLLCCLYHQDVGEITGRLRTQSMFVVEKQEAELLKGLFVYSSVHCLCVHVVCVCERRTVSLVEEHVSILWI